MKKTWFAILMITLILGVSVTAFAAAKRDRVYNDQSVNNDANDLKKDTKKAGNSLKHDMNKGGEEVKKQAENLKTDVNG